MAKKIKPLLLLLIMSFSTIVAFAYDKPQYDNNFLISVLFKTQELRDNAISEIKKIDMEIAKNNETIQKSEKIIALAQQRSDAKEKQAESVARDALMKAQETKRKNEETFNNLRNTLESIDKTIKLLKPIIKAPDKVLNRDENYMVQVSAETYKSTKNLIVVNQTKKKTEVQSVQPQLKAPSYMDQSILPVNCKEALKYLGRSDCYCIQPNRAPLCGGADSKPSNAKMYIFYWSAEVVGSNGILVTDGTYFGRHSSYDDAFNACKDEANKVIKEGNILNIVCTPTFADGKNIF